MKPIVFAKSNKKKYQSTKLQENMLLRAFSETDDITTLKNVAKFHTEADVMRAMDKISIRKEYHDALVRNGLTIDQIVRHINTIVLTSTSDKVKTTLLGMLLKSIGLDKYDDSESSGKNWEQLLLDVVEKQADTPLLETSEKGKNRYEVVTPPVPESYKNNRKEEDDFGRSLYDK